MSDKFFKQFHDFKRFPAINPYECGVKYTKLAIDQKVGKLDAPTQDELDRLFRTFRDYHPEMSDENYARLYCETVDKFHNCGLYRFVLDHKGLESSFFLPWIANVPKAITLEAAFGYGYDVNGIFRDIPETDPFYWWVIREPMFVYLRERATRTAGALYDRKRILFLGAGYLPELRHTSYHTLYDQPQSIIACDIDSDIGSRNFLATVPSKYAVRYFQRDMSTFLGDGKYSREFDAVVMNGVMSYHLGEMPKLIDKSIQLLGSGGIFLFDLQLKHWNLERDAAAFGWITYPPMQLMSNSNIARDEVRKITRQLRAIKRSTAIVDTYNDTPTGVMFKLTV